MWTLLTNLNSFLTTLNLITKLGAFIVSNLLWVSILYAPLDHVAAKWASEIHGLIVYHGRSILISRYLRFFIFKNLFKAGLRWRNSPTIWPHSLCWQSQLWRCGSEVSRAEKIDENGLRHFLSIHCPSFHPNIFKFNDSNEMFMNKLTLIMLFSSMKFSPFKADIYEINSLSLDIIIPKDYIWFQPFWSLSIHLKIKKAR